MKFLRYVFRAGVQRIFNARLGVFTIIMLLASWSYNRPLRNFSVEMKYPCSVWVYPFMLAQYAFLVLFFFAVIYANADIPFMQYSNMYSLIRAGRKKWGAAQMLILLFRSVILTGVSCLCSIVTLLPHIELTADWGKLIKTVAMGMMQGSYNLKYSFFYEVMIKLSPLELMALSVGITVGVIFFCPWVCFWFRCIAAEQQQFLERHFMCCYCFWCSIRILRSEILLRSWCLQLGYRLLVSILRIWDTIGFRRCAICLSV